MFLKTSVIFPYVVDGYLFPHAAVMAEKTIPPSQLSPTPHQKPSPHLFAWATNTQDHSWNSFKAKRTLISSHAITAYQLGCREESPIRGEKVTSSCRWHLKRTFICSLSSVPSLSELIWDHQYNCYPTKTDKATGPVFKRWRILACIFSQIQNI